jgi:large subunit ribosomal protein L13
MSTFMAKQQEVERAWYVLDAAGTPMGRTAAQAAVLLHGKHKPEFTPHVDGGDHVIIINADQAVLTGKKLDQKFHRTHSGYVGGLKETKYRFIMEKRPEKAMRLAISGMLPKNKHRDLALARLKIYAGPEHPHASQKPALWNGGIENV